MKGMIYAFVVLLLLQGCASVNVEAPIVHHTDSLELMDVPDITVRDLPKKPKGVLATAVTPEGNTVELVGFDTAAMNQLSDMRTVAKTNTALAVELNKSTRALVMERNALVSVAQSTEHRANILAEEWARAEAARQREENWRGIEKTFYQTLLVILAAAAIL